MCRTIHLGTIEFYSSSKSTMNKYNGYWNKLMTQMHIIIKQIQKHYRITFHNFISIKENLFLNFNNSYD